MTKLLGVVEKKKVFKVVGVFFSLLFSGVLGWYVNYALSHSNASVSINSVELYYDFPDPSHKSFEDSKLVFGQDEAETDNSAFISYSLSLKTPLESLNLTFSEADNDNLRKVFLTIRQNVHTLLDMVSVDEPNQDQIANTFLDYIQTSTNTIMYIYWLHTNNKVTFPNTDYVKVLNSHLTSGGDAIRLSRKHYLLLDTFQHPPKDNRVTFNFVLVARETVYRLAAMIILRDYSTLKPILRATLANLDNDEGISLKTLDIIHSRAKDVLQKYSKLRIKIDVSNPSGFPISLYSSGDVLVSLPGTSKLLTYKGVVSKTTESSDADNVKSSIENRFATHLLQANQHESFTFALIEPLGDADQEIRARMKAKALSFQVRLKQRKDVFFQSSRITSEQMDLQGFQ
jgi:hypothetical protein